MNVGLVSATLGYSRQYFYKHCQQQKDRATTEQTVLTMAQAERKVLPQLGGKKIYHLIKPLLALQSVAFGRDRLFVLLGHNGLLIRPKRRYTQTTNSRHWLRKYPNLVKDMNIVQPEQVWVSDITYIKTDEGMCYLNLVTDASSRKIMGYAIAGNMDTNSMKPAYEMALKARTWPDRPLVHHSDRGLQYCSADYVELSTANNVKISMTENGDPYENALAERMNRTLKEEFGLGRPLPSKQQAFRLAEEAVWLYNNQRPHMSLNMDTPQNVHSQKIPVTVATRT